jgi:hypothetical protein
MQTTLITIVAVIGIALSQDTCDWYQWGDEDWAVDQDFSQSEYSLNHPHSYLDTPDFEEGGYYHGQKWEDVFFNRSDPENRTAYHRPLGFRYGILGSYNDPMICINVTGGGNYRVELMAYSFTSGASLAATDLAVDPYDLQSNAVTNVNGPGKLYQCFMGPTKPSALMQLSIFCPRSDCQDGETHLLWRLRRSGSFSTKGEFANKNPDMWCMTIGANIKWPDQINDDSPKSYSNANANAYESGALQVSVMLSTLLTVVFALFQ